MNNIYALILAGGKGERLWPLSRKKKPKQLLPFYDGKSLLEQSVTRLETIIPQKNLWVVTTKEQTPIIKKIVGKKVGQIIEEPASCNTAPAILLSCLELYKIDPEATAVFLPADPYIDNNELFCKYLSQAVSYSQQNEVISLLGLKPHYAATGYGYIEYEKNDNEIKKIVRFHEKPSKEVAELYFTAENMLWNIGIFCAKVKTFIDEYKKVAPKLYEGMLNFFEGKGLYRDFENVSVDYAVMEKSKRLVVIPADFEWSDVGNLETFLTLQKRKRTKQPRIINIESKNNIVEGGNSLVALLGVEDLCIVQTDDVLLITKRDQTEKVKTVLQELKQKKFEEYL